MSLVFRDMRQLREFNQSGRHSGRQHWLLLLYFQQMSNMLIVSSAYKISVILINSFHRPQVNSPLLCTKIKVNIIMPLFQIRTKKKKSTSFHPTWLPKEGPSCPLAPLLEGLTPLGAAVFKFSLV